jgi:hypothetical protein
VPRKKRRDAEQRYQDALNKQKRILYDFIAHETEWADHLMLWYRVKKLDMPEDEYRGCAYFLNKEYRNKKGSIIYLYEANLRCETELPDCTKETAFDLVRYKYKVYAHVLSKLNLRSIF